MARRNQIIILIKQELKLARRSKYMMISFIILPLIMWGFQGGLQYFIITQIEGGDEDIAPFEGKTLYLMNADLGNDSLNFGNILRSNISTIQHDEQSSMYNIRMKYVDGAKLNQSELENRVLNERISPLVYVSTNFTVDILTYNQSENVMPPTVDIYYLPEDRRFGEAVLSAIWEIVSQEPFQRVDLIKDTDLSIQIVTYEGEESAGSTFFTGFIGFIVIMLSVIAPGPYVSSSFAGEKEKGTMESLISLPMRRFDILLSKLIAGMGLVTIFSFMNILGLMLYQYLITQANLQTDTEVLGSAVNLGLSALVSIFFMILLTSFASIGLGICIASLISDTRTAESTYTLIMMVPAMIVGFAAMYGSLPEGFSLMLLIPWTHSLLILNKGLFPQTYADYTLSSSIYMDILMHIGYLVIFVVVSLFVASKLFDREGLIK